ncbi:hypothetical protein [Chryseobacterium flavum]|nr:hypothetical protein [Chryseobacterium flavum]
MLSPPDIEQLLQFALAQRNYGTPSNAFMGMEHQMHALCNNFQW